MEWTGILALVIAVPLIIGPLALIWYMIGGGTYHLLRDRRMSRSICSIDADCPQGYTCVNGTCVPA